MSSASARLTPEAIAAQLGPQYSRYSPAARRVHADLIACVDAPSAVGVDATALDDGLWEITVCTTDQVGTLSLVAGLLTAHRGDIVEGEVFTVRREPSSADPRPVRPRSPRRQRRSTPVPPSSVILDVFNVRPPAGTGAGLWDRFRNDLGEVMELLAAGEGPRARDLVIDRVAGSLREAEQGAVDQLLPVSVEVDQEADPGATVLVIQSMDVPGFLFEFTNALAILQVSIARAQIRTVEGETLDTFHVTDAGGRKITEPARLEEIRVAAALIKQFTHLLSHAPDPAQALRQFSALCRGMLSRPDQQGGLRDLAHSEVLDTLADLMGVSRFLWEDFLRLQHENLFPVLTDPPALDLRKSPAALRDELQATSPVTAAELNAFKDREMFRIDLRHITRRIGFAEFSRELSDLADVVVPEAAAIAHRQLQDRYGVPRLASGKPCRWAVAALGKFGGREIGFASDLELVFVYEDAGKTSGPEVVPNSTYFADFVRAFRNTITASREGIFELDLRLRPYGDGGALATSVEAFRNYYSPGGAAQQFERMAIVRLRPVAGDGAIAAALLQARDAFAYSGEPLDVANIRHLRARQAAELVPAGRLNAKYSPGGVVDIEYYVQVCQIRAGALDASVRLTGTLEAAEALTEAGHMDQDTSVKLREAYGVLRRLTDALRVVRGNAKDLTLPARDSREFVFLARRLFYESPEALDDAITVRMKFARELWEQ